MPTATGAFDRRASADGAEVGRVPSQQLDVTGVDVAARREQAGQVEGPGRVVDRPHDGPVVDARADRPPGRGAPAGAGLRQLVVGAVGERTDAGSRGVPRQLLEQVGDRLARRSPARR